MDVVAMKLGDLITAKDQTRASRVLSRACLASSSNAGTPPKLMLSLTNLLPRQQTASPRSSQRLRQPAMAEVPVQNDVSVTSESDLVSKVQIEPTTEKRQREEVFTRVRLPSAW